MTAVYEAIHILYMKRTRGFNLALCSLLILAFCGIANLYKALAVLLAQTSQNEAALVNRFYTA
jgi:hypothetical protein